MKLITYTVKKEYPGSPQIGTRIIPKTVGTRFLGYYYKGVKFNPENYPEFFTKNQPITWLEYLKKKYKINKAYNPFLK